MTQTILQSWDKDRWPNFSYKEFQCSKTGLCYIRVALLDMLQTLRYQLGFPLNIVSGYRDRSHDREKHKSFIGVHTLGFAVDIRIAGEQAFTLISQASQCGFTGLGIYQKGDWYSRFIHLDICHSRLNAMRPSLWSY